MADIVAASAAPAERSGGGGDLALPHFREEKTTFIFVSRESAILKGLLLARAKEIQWQI